MSLGTGVLNIAIADSWWIELLRWVAIFVGGSMVGLAPIAFATRRSERASRKRQAGFVAFVAAGMFAVLQEIDQLGKPMLVWRLPLLLIIVLGGFYTMFGPDDERHKDRPRS